MEIQFDAPIVRVNYHRRGPLFPMNFGLSEKSFIKRIWPTKIYEIRLSRSTRLPGSYASFQNLHLHLHLHHHPPAEKGQYSMLLSLSCTKLFSPRLWTLKFCSHILFSCIDMCAIMEELKLRLTLVCLISISLCLIDLQSGFC